MEENVELDQVDTGAMEPLEGHTPSTLEDVPEDDSLSESDGEQPELPLGIAEISQKVSEPTLLASELQHIYLVKPLTRGIQRVLIPINANMKLEDALRNQEVIEFPTIQVLSQSSENLPDNFILDTAYMVKFNIQEQELKDLVTSNDDLLSHPQPRREDKSSDRSHRISNTDDILAILNRDIHST